MADTTNGTVPGARSRSLHAKIELLMPGLRAAAARLWAAPGLRLRYPAYLGAMHAVITASVPLMETALAEAVRRGEPALAGYLRRHIEEERGHDDWLRADLAVLGHAPGRPSAAAAALVGAQYYWTLHHHPAALLGYIAAMEGFPPTDALMAHLRAVTGFPPAAFRTLRHHGELDLGHRAELDAVLDGLPLTPEQEQAVGLSALHTVHAATRLFTGLLGPTAQNSTAEDFKEEPWNSTPSAN
ncbi:iron-containing redox enzyme family protein [Planobispora takensis]|uniref:Iron-containing redox enzyme family protein n=1 Tax=Planobispora takensis TaxID=1367882 RepID=A0A8J3WTC8_9ACTN|nr:iron-containing redox enzyme family protein [Planobispora takensis]GII01391.1 hypothetical protein Pta02_33990 [Planobispora takensis]